MATGKEELYISSRSSGKSTITVGEVASLAETPTATTSVRGTVFMSSSITPFTGGTGGSGGADMVIKAVPAPIAATTGADTATLPTLVSTAASIENLRYDLQTVISHINVLEINLRAAGILLPPQ